MTPGTGTFINYVKFFSGGFQIIVPAPNTLVVLYYTPRGFKKTSLFLTGPHKFYAYPDPYFTFNADPDLRLFA